MYWYCNQMFCVKWVTTFSEYFTVSNGVRQGGIMSPILFNVYMNNLSVELNKCKTGCNINGTFINHLMYADDSCLIAPCPSALQDLVDICETFANNNCIVYNAKKSKCMCFKPKVYKQLYIPPIYLNEKPLTFVECQKYLGMNISNDLTDDADLKRQVKAMYVRGNMLVHNFKFCSDNVKNTLFKCYCSNSYGSELWSLYKKETYKKCVVAYNDIYRKLFNIRRGESMSALYVLNGIDSFNVIVRKYIYSFKTRIEESCNILIGAILSSAFYLTYSSLARKWDNLLYLM